jgi:FrmR/RcnR family transcriptional regulator, repressor of frmRAB operon
MKSCLAGEARVPLRVLLPLSFNVQQVTKTIDGIPPAFSLYVAPYSDLYRVTVYAHVHRMPYSTKEKRRALIRVRRIRGQIDALERTLEHCADCSPALPQLAAIRGALNRVMASVLESQLCEEFTQLADGQSPRNGSIDDFVTLVRTYLR